MSELNWSEDYSVGIPTIDNEHKFLVSLINEMGRALHTHRSFQAQIIGDGLKNLTHCIHRHFKSEESFLLLNKYPEYDAHKAEHVALLEQLEHFDKRFRGSNQPFTEEMLLFLKDWLVTHVLLHDCKFGVYFKGKELIQSPSGNSE
jgi:hemerythrin